MKLNQLLTTYLRSYGGNADTWGDGCELEETNAKT